MNKNEPILSFVANLAAIYPGVHIFIYLGSYLGGTFTAQ
jgi:hypothetical protein